MRYRVTISRDGTRTETEVIDRGEHECKEIVNVCNGFGRVSSVTDKNDENPVREVVHVNK